MANVYQVCGVTITKDLIFGWVVQLKGDWYRIEDLSKEILEALSLALYPAWIPEELRILVQKTLKTKEAINLRLKEKEGVYTKSEPHVVTNREEDAKELTDHITRELGRPLSNLHLNDLVSLGYVSLSVVGFSNQGSEPLFDLINKKGEKVNPEPVLFKQAVDLILRIWW